MLERIGAISIIIGIVLGISSLCWLLLLVVWRRLQKRSAGRLWTPLVLILLSLVLATLPIAVNSVLSRFANLDAMNKIVNRERHLTLTGWDRKDYSAIVRFKDTVVLQMANADVTDETLNYLSGMQELRELDLSNSQISDAGLAVIAALPKLQDLRLARTKITDAGFRTHLLDKASLLRLDLTEASVSSKTVREWKSSNPDRKALK